MRIKILAKESTRTFFHHRHQCSVKIENNRAKTESSIGRAGLGVSSTWAPNLALPLGQFLTLLEPQSFHF